MLDEHERRDVELNIRRLYQLIESLETMTKALLEEQEMLTNATVQQSEAVRTLEALADIGEDHKEMVIPIGGSAFIKGRMELSPTAIIRIGTDLLVEKPIPGAIETLGARLAELESAIGEHEDKIGALKERRANTLAQIEDLRSLL